jgi:hypothetical protein
MRITIEFSWFRKDKMKCPRCDGKGFVDSIDLHRLMMNEKWGVGWCRYCCATGQVDQGKPKYVNPLRRDIGPSIHPTDLPQYDPSDN